LKRKTYPEFQTQKKSRLQQTPVKKEQQALNKQNTVQVQPPYRSQIQIEKVKTKY